MGSGIGKTRRAKAAVAAGPDQHGLLNEEQTQLIAALLGTGPDGQDHGVVKFASSSVCPDELRTQILLAAECVTERGTSGVDGGVAAGEDMFYTQSFLLLRYLSSESICAALNSATDVPLKTREIIHAAAQRVKDDLVQRKVLDPTNSTVVIAAARTELPENASERETVGIYFDGTNVAMVAEHLVNNDDLLRMIIAHELVHSNEPTHDFFAEHILNFENFPSIDSSETNFLREGLVDWLARNYSMSDPSKPLPHAGVTTAEKVNRYAANVAFVQEHIVPHLSDNLKEGETLEGKMASLLRFPPGETMLTTVIRNVPSVQQELEQLTAQMQQLSVSMRAATSPRPSRQPCPPTP